jgi:hypothetical protein
MATALLLTAFVLPVFMFWLLSSRARLNGLVAAGIAVAAGWATNFAWASVAHESVPIAARFGWVCPAVLVLLTWLVLRFMSRRAA